MAHPVENFDSMQVHDAVNPLWTQPQSNGPLYSNTVIGTLAVDGWAVRCYIWYSDEGTGRAAVPSSLYQM